MSLTTCIKKAGKALRAEDKKAIHAFAREHRKGGLSAQDAGRKAIQDQLNAVTALLAAPVVPVAAPAAPPETLIAAPAPQKTVDVKAAEASAPLPEKAPEPVASEAIPKPEPKEEPAPASDAVDAPEDKSPKVAKKKEPETPEPSAPEVVVAATPDIAPAIEVETDKRTVTSDSGLNVFSEPEPQAKPAAATDDGPPTEAEIEAIGDVTITVQTDKGPAKLTFNAAKAMQSINQRADALEMVKRCLK